MKLTMSRISSIKLAIIAVIASGRVPDRNARHHAGAVRTRLQHQRNVHFGVHEPVDGPLVQRPGVHAKIQPVNDRETVLDGPAQRRHRDRPQ